MKHNLTTTYRIKITFHIFKYRAVLYRKWFIFWIPVDRCAGDYWKVNRQCAAWMNVYGEMEVVRR